MSSTPLFKPAKLCLSSKEEGAPCSDCRKEGRLVEDSVDLSDVLFACRQAVICGKPGDAIKLLHPYVFVLQWCPEVCFTVGITANLREDAPLPHTSPFFLHA